MANAVPVIDADGHLVEPPAVWQEYAEPPYRDLVLQVRDDALWLEGRKYGANPAPACIPGALSDPNTPVTWDDLLPGGYDARARLQVLDDERLSQAIFFPSIYLLAGDVQSPDV